MSLAAGSAGWLAGNTLVILLALTLAPDLNWRFWLLASSALCLVGWLIVGLPLSIQGRSVAPGKPRAKAVFYAAVVAFGIIVFIALRFVAAGVRDPWHFIGVAGGQAIATGTISMMLFFRLVDRIEGRR